MSTGKSERKGSEIDPMSKGSFKSIRSSIRDECVCVSARFGDTKRVDTENALKGL